MKVAAAADVNSLCSETHHSTLTVVQHQGIGMNKQA